MNKVFLLGAIVAACGFCGAAEQLPTIGKSPWNERLLRSSLLTRELSRFPEPKLPQSPSELSAEKQRRLDWERPIVCSVRSLRKGVFEFSVGPHDWLDQGDRLDVYRGEQRLGLVMLGKVGHRVAIGVAEPDVPLGPLETGDNLRRVGPRRF